MTLRTTSKLICECGHTGTLRTSENDAPYSSNWVSHKLEGFRGSVSEDGELTDVTCLECGKTGKVTYAPKT